MKVKNDYYKEKTRSMNQNKSELLIVVLKYAHLENQHYNTTIIHIITSERIIESESG